MTSRWSHFPSSAAKHSTTESREEQHVLGSATTDSLSLALPRRPPSSRAVGAQISKRNDNIFHGSHGMGPLSPATSEMTNMPSEVPPQTYGGESTEAPIPCRNLTEAFEELVRVEPGTEVAAQTPATKQLDSSGKADGAKDMSEVSPTGVADLDVAPPSSTASTAGTSSTATPIQKVDSPAPITKTPTAEEANEDALPHFFLHDDLKKDLSQALVNRVSFYGVIRDINQEALSMAANDNSLFAKGEATEENEDLSPLVIAVNGKPAEPKPTEDSKESFVEAALIDEERWLLAAIESRVNADEPRVCPPTFSEAMGEREYENPLSSLQTSRTQLWKPSRSWWEAKSGKNPWIEPKSHNKRWRYLWPLIHYHKFLAKCIKKLKRNGVDVKSSVSPVAVFLREEVCAVSDHLASVSLFTSEEWMTVLGHFNGWTDSDSKAEARLRKLVSKQKLRPLAEQCDVDSPLLRSQIDEQFLKAMATSRDQMINGAAIQERKSAKRDTYSHDAKAGTVKPIPASSEGRSKRKNGPSMANHATPPLPQYINAKSPAEGRKPRWKGGKPGQKRTPGYPSSAGNWPGSGWRHPSQHYHGDDTSAHSGSFSTMSVDAHPQHVTGRGEYGAYQGTPGFYPPPHHHFSHPSPGPNGPGYFYYHQHPAYHHDAASYAVSEPYLPEHSSNAGYPGHPDFGDPNLAVYGGMPVRPNHDSSPHYGPPPGYAGASASGGDMPPSPYHYSPALASMDPQFSMQQNLGVDQTPFKYSPHAGKPGQASPYFDHINPLANLFTPQSKVTPATPKKENSSASDSKSNEKSVEKDDSFAAPSVNVEFARNAKPLLLNHPSQYYHYGQHGAMEGYVPPSPATQFMMSPQANPQAAAYFARNQAHVSPQRSLVGRSMVNALVTVESADSEMNDEPIPSVHSDAGKAVTNGKTDVTPPPAVRKIAGNISGRGSPSTVQTAAESESQNETA